LPPASITYCKQMACGIISENQDAVMGRFAALL